MLSLSPKTETKLQELTAETRQSVEQLIEAFIPDYQDEQESIKRADRSYAEYLESGVSFSLAKIKQELDTGSA